MAWKRPPSFFIVRPVILESFSSTTTTIIIIDEWIGNDCRRLIFDKTTEVWPRVVKRLKTSKFPALSQILNERPNGMCATRHRFKIKYATLSVITGLRVERRALVDAIKWRMSFTCSWPRQIMLLNLTRKIVQSERQWRSLSIHSKLKPRP